jgi:hypothetical protein
LGKRCLQPSRRSGARALGHPLEFDDGEVMQAALIFASSAALAFASSAALASACSSMV